ncbi:MAG: hypothetical protein Q7J82_08735 [Coriobacteriia bacterium]|nr:hypothetical protein [Coriobacteriia bacterium]
MEETRSGTWTTERARRDNRKWVRLAIGMGLVTVLLLSVAIWLPYAWTLVMWNSQCAAATTVETDVVQPDTPYADVVAALGPVSYEAPGFSRNDVPDAAVCVWQNTEFGEVRGLFMSGRLVGSLLVFE